MAGLGVNIGGLKLRNPVMTASGTFGYGTEYKDFVDFSRLGGIVVKGTTLEPRQGNDYPRMAETASGMLNAVGLQNKGVDHFVSHMYPEILHYDTEIVVNVSGSTIEDYVACVDKLAPLDRVGALELNISCPNVKEGGMAFGTSAKSAARITAAVRRAYSGTLIVKLSPNVTDITEIARAVESEGADALSLVNTFLGMAIDVDSRSPKLSTVTGGLSGPCIKPIALRMVWQVYNSVQIPVIGLGGISCWQDAIEFILAGATAIQVGTYNFIDPSVTMKIVDGIERYLDINGFKTVQELIGKLIIK